MVQNFDSPLNPSQETNDNEAFNLANSFNQSMDIDQDTGMYTESLRAIKSVFFKFKNQILKILLRCINK